MSNPGMADGISHNLIKILLVDAHAGRASLLKRGILGHDYQIVEILTDTAQLVAVAQRARPDLVVLGTDLLDQKTLAQMIELRTVYPLPLVVFAEQDAPQIIQQVIKAGVGAYVVNDIQPQRFASIFNIALARFNEQQALWSELELTRNKLAERKLVDKAKGLLMSQHGLSEDEAYRSLRKMAMDKGYTLAKVAQNIIDVLSILPKSGRI